MEVSQANNDNVPFSYTMAKDKTVDAMIGVCLERVRGSIETMPLSRGISAVVLGGGYGRGKGGVISHNGRMYPYNDLDFFVFTKGLSKAQRQEIDVALGELSRELSEELRVDVDFCSAREEKSLVNVSNTLMYQELLAGHVMVYGSESALSCILPLPASKIPGLEGMRMMLNRGAGLLFALRRLASGESASSDGGFVIRNLQKCVLGCGDALLICGHEYDYSLEKRQEKLCGSDFSGDFEYHNWLSEKYKDAVLFKGHPTFDISDSEVKALSSDLTEVWEKTLWLCLEQLLPGVDVHGAGLTHCLWKACVNGQPVKNAILNIMYGVVRLWSSGIFMAPQGHLLVRLRELLQRAHDDSSFRDFERLWRRFN